MAVPFKATLFHKTGEKNWLIAWHQDAALPLSDHFDDQGWGPWSWKAGVRYARAPAWALERVVALRVQLDDSDAGNGPLRVVPGSHRFGVLSDAEVLSHAANSDSVDCCCEAGGVILMSPLVIHASSKSTNDQPRRVLHIEYADSLDLAPGIRLALA